MKISRLFLPLFFAFALLSAQQAGAAHALSHALEQSQQQDKQAPHSTVCEKCENFAQLGNALNAGNYDVALLTATSEAVAYFALTAPSLDSPPASARGPPVTLKKTV